MGIYKPLRNWVDFPIPYYMEIVVGGFSPSHLKNMLVKLEILPREGGEKSKNVWVATT